MIVCVCHAVCERRLEAAVAAGNDTPEKIERHCGAGGDCGTCRPEIERLIERITLGAPRCGASHATGALPAGVNS